MMTIWKYELPNADNAIQMPKGAKILHLNVQKGRSMFDPYLVPCVWALVDDTAPVVPRLIAFAGTGHTAPGERAEYVGTLHFMDDSLVIHAFAKIED